MFANEEHDWMIFHSQLNVRTPMMQMAIACECITWMHGRRMWMSTSRRRGVLWLMQAEMPWWIDDVCWCIHGTYIIFIYIYILYNIFIMLLYMIMIPVLSYVCNSNSWRLLVDIFPYRMQDPLNHSFGSTSWFFLVLALWRLEISKNDRDKSYLVEFVWNC